MRTRPKQCRTCLFYDEEEEAMLSEFDDQLLINDPRPPHEKRRYCSSWPDKDYNIIPLEVCENKVKCPHYIMDHKFEEKHQIVIVKVCDK